MLLMFEIKGFAIIDKRMLVDFNAKCFWKHAFFMFYQFNDLVFYLI